MTDIATTTEPMILVEPVRNEAGKIRRYALVTFEGEPVMRGDKPLTHEKRVDAEADAAALNASIESDRAESPEQIVETTPAPIIESALANHLAECVTPDELPDAIAAERERIAARRESEPRDAQDRVAHMSDDDLPPIQPPITGDDSQPITAAKRATSKHSRAVAGRIRSRATAASYHVEFTDDDLTPPQVEQIDALREHVAAWDRYVDAAIADPATASDERERDLVGQVSAFVYHAWDAGVPTTIIGSVIGASGGSARGRALRYAESMGVERPTPLRRTSDTLKPRDPVSVAARYADVLRPVYVAATSPDAGRADLDAAIVAAFRTGVGVTSIARVAGMTPGTARSIAHKALTDAGERIPSNDERRAARAALDVPSLPDD